MAKDILLFVVLAICVYTDFTRQKIYNFILLPAIFLALFYHFLAGGLVEGWWSLQGLLLGIALLFIPFSMGGIGAGDVKLLGMIGAFNGPEFVLFSFLAGAVAGGIMSLWYLLKEKILISTLVEIAHKIYFWAIGARPMAGQTTGKQIHATITMPYGVAIALGTAVAYCVR